MFFHMYIAPGQGQTTLCGHNPDVNRKALSLCPFVASFKKISLKSDFIHKFSCFYAPPPESGGVLCYTLRNFECPSVCPSVSAHHHSCIGNSSYSFRPILLKLYRCFKDGLKICILFFQNPEIIFYHFFPIFMPRHQKVAGYYVIPSKILSVRPSVRLSVCPSVCPSVRQRPPPFLYRQLLLQF